MTRPVALWLERKLDFPAWTEADIRSMRETHVSEWARTEGVEMDPRYASEDREGGTRALGAGIPGLTRDDLSVFTADQWQFQKNRMIHETWLTKARAASMRNRQR